MIKFHQYKTYNNHEIIHFISDSTNAYFQEKNNLRIKSLTLNSDMSQF